MKKNKLKRIFAFTACLIVLLTMCILPAFADIVLDPQPFDPAFVYLEFSEFLPSAMNTDSYRNLRQTMLDTYRNDPNMSWQEYLFSSVVLTSGNVTHYSTGYPFDVTAEMLQWTSYCDWCLQIDGVYYSALNRLVRLIVANDEYMYVHFYDEQDANGFSNTLTVTFRYAAYEEGSTALSSEIVGIEYVDGRNNSTLREFDLRYVDDISLTVARHYNPDTDCDDGFVAALGRIFFKEPADNTRSPYSYYYGYCSGVEFQLDNTDAYNEGYQDAVNEIDSGEFGANFLGNILSSPFKMLRNFTVVNWSIGSRLVVITMADLLSAVIGVGLFVWLLKIFAGG